MPKQTKKTCEKKGGSWRDNECQDLPKKKIKRKSRPKRKTEPRWTEGVNKTNLMRFYEARTGLPRDTFDFESLDKTLTFSEARNYIENNIPYIRAYSDTSKEKITKRDLDDLFEQQIYSRHEIRSERSQKMDEIKAARNSISIEECLKNEENKKKCITWLMHPNRTDIRGIDYPQEESTPKNLGVKDIKISKITHGLSLNETNRFYKKNGGWIAVEKGRQARVEMFAEELKRKKKQSVGIHEPIKVLYDPKTKTYKLWDGAHRLAAYSHLKRKNIPAEVWIK